MGVFGHISPENFGIPVDFEAIFWPNEQNFLIPLLAPAADTAIAVSGHLVIADIYFSPIEQFYLSIAGISILIFHFLESR